MKKVFEIPEISIYEISVSDIITTSGPDNMNSDTDGENTGEIPW